MLYKQECNAKPLIRDITVMEESLTLSISATSSNLEVQYFPPIELRSDRRHVLGLVELLTFNSIPNVVIHNNKLKVAEKLVTIPVGSYEISDLEEYIKDQLQDVDFSLTPNNNTLRSSVKCSSSIDFRTEDSIGSLLGFTKRLLEPNTTHESDLPVKILKVNSIRIECNITAGAYLNGECSHSIHEFFPAVPPGYKIIEIPSQVIYLPVTVRRIDSIKLRLVDQNGDLLNFRGETISIRLHLKSI